MILSLLLLHYSGFIKAYNVFNKIAGKFHYFLVTGAAALKRQTLTMFQVLRFSRWFC